MGRQNRRRKGGNWNKGGEGSNQNRHERWSERPTTSRIYKEYYEAQCIAKDDDDMKGMLEALARPLPATIRLHAQGKFVKHLRDHLKGDLQEGYPVHTVGDEKKKAVMHQVTSPPEPIAWYPEENGWRFGADKETIRKISGMRRLKEFLLHEGEAGNLTRQEEASMIPPFFLDVQRHHRVLDMCAAPGSKTSQILEAMHFEDAQHDFREPPGVVVANDCNEKRAYMLVKQSKRMNSGNLLVTAHEAQRFPLIRLGNEDPAQEGFFDRILADVPCSGDGTCRKSPDIWRSFDPRNGFVLHSLQLMIAQRGLELLKVGGLLVYSTCSLNPVENEAVVAQIIRANKGNVELMDASSVIPALKRRPGITNWKLALLSHKKKSEMAAEAQSGETTDEKEVESADPIGDGPAPEIDGALPSAYLRWFENPEEARALGFGPRIPYSSYPPSNEEIESLHLERCMRIMPHDQDTSGFFICVLKKVAPVGQVHILKRDLGADKPVEEEPDSSEEQAMEVATGEPTKKEKGNQKRKPETGEAAKADDEGKSDEKSEEQAQNIRDDDLNTLPEFLYEKIRNFYGVGEEDLTKNQLYWRGGGGEMISKQALKKRKLEREEKLANQEHFPSNIHFVSKVVSEILSTNEKNNLKIVSFGSLMFKKNQQGSANDPTYRVTQAGVKLALPYITKNVVHITLDDFVMIWKFMNHTPLDPEAAALASRFAGAPLKLMSQETIDRIKKEKLRGSAVAALIPEHQAKFVDQFGEPFALSVWIGSDTFAAMVSKLDMNGMFDMAKRGDLVSEAAVENVDMDAMIKLHFASRSSADSGPVA